MHSGAAIAGVIGTLDLKCSYVSASSDQMALSESIWLNSFLPVKADHGYGSVDSAWPSGGFHCGCCPWGNSHKIIPARWHCKYKFLNNCSKVTLEIQNETNLSQRDVSWLEIYDSKLLWNCWIIERNTVIWNYIVHLLYSKIFFFLWLTYLTPHHQCLSVQTHRDCWNKLKYIWYCQHVN